MSIPNAKTLIGVLASHDSSGKNQALSQIFIQAYDSITLRNLLKQFRFVFTGGTYRRLFCGEQAHLAPTLEVSYRLPDEIGKFLHNECGVVRLPSTEEGGVIMLTHLITQRKVNIIWPFLSPMTAHLLFPENLALLRLADQWHVKRLMNMGSVMEWLILEADRDKNLNRQPIPVRIELGGSGMVIEYGQADISSKVHTMTKTETEQPNFYAIDPPARLNNIEEELKKTVVALIAHDATKDRIIDFVIDYEHELSLFKTIIATGTTGKLIEEASSLLAKRVKKYHHGPKGGDIEIATEILNGGCHVVIFFVDPLNPHPHIEDIRVVFGACMINDKVRMLSNEIQARDWMDRVVRGR